MSEKRDAYVKKVQAKLDEWNAEIDRLEAKAESAAADARVQYEEQIAKAKASRDDLRQKLGEIRKAGDEAWQELKSGLDQAWDSLSAAVKSARSKFDE